MAKSNAFVSFRTVLLVGLALVISLSACSGGAASLNPTAKDALLESSPAQAAVNQALPKAAKAASDDPSLNSAAPVQPAGLNAGSVPAEPQAALEIQPAAAAPVDLSLPVEPKVGARAPEFTLQTLDGQTVSLASLAGRPVVIAYWATWCIPCQAELPVLQQLAQEYASTGLTVVTINAIDQDSLEEIQAMLGEKGLTLPVLLDQGAQFASTYGALFFPSTYYVDASGVIRFIKLGDSTPADLRSHVEALIRGDL